MRRGFKNPYGPNLAFWAVFLVVTVLLLSGALWVISFVRGTVVSAAEEEITLNQAYINYSTAGDYVQTSSITAVQAYIAEFPEPQNAQVLTGMTTSEIWGFMTTYMAGGLQVDCTYCHNVENFGADGADIGDDEVAARKDNARLHLQMVADLNQNWIGQLADIEGKQPSRPNHLCNLPLR